MNRETKFLVFVSFILTNIGLANFLSILSIAEAFEEIIILDPTFSNWSAYSQEA